MSKTKAIPIFRETIIKNPKTLFPVDWEKRLSEDDYWYEFEPELDELGNMVTKRNLYIIERKVIGFYRPKKKVNLSHQKPLFALKGDKEDETK